MCHSSRGSFRNQVNFLRRQFLQDGDLLFTNVLTEEGACKPQHRPHRLAGPDLFPTGRHALGLSRTGPECGSFPSRAAVARLIAHRLAQKARAPRRPALIISLLLRCPNRFSRRWPVKTGRALEANVGPQWLWKGRHVYLIRWHDGHHA